MNPYTNTMTIKLTPEVREKYRQLPFVDKIDYITFTNIYKKEQNIYNNGHYFEQWYERYEIFLDNSKIPDISITSLKNIIYDPELLVKDLKKMDFEKMIPIFERFGQIKNYFKGGKKRTRRKKPKKKKNKYFKRMKTKRRYKLNL